MSQGFFSCYRYRSSAGIRPVTDTVTDTGSVTGTVTDRDSLPPLHDINTSTMDAVSGAGKGHRNVFISGPYSW